MEEKYEKFIENYQQGLLYFWNTVKEALIASFKLIEVFLLIPIVMLMIFITFPFYCLGYLLRRT